MQTVSIQRPVGLTREPVAVAASQEAWRFWALVGAYLTLWALLAIDPKDSAIWIMENAVPLILLGVVIFVRRWFVFSFTSYALLILFVCLHSIGAHYTYSQVPYDQWWQTLTGATLNEAVGWNRNQYDRLIHFSYGLLVAYPLYELLLRTTRMHWAWVYVLPVEIVLSTSAIFELLEWWVVTVFGQRMGTMYLGSQGDGWDTQKDIALALLGSAVVIGSVAAGRFLRRCVPCSGSR